MNDLSRRQFLTIGTGAACSLIVPSSAKALILPKSLNEKWLHLHNTHTGEFFRGPYWAGGRYVRDSLKQLNSFFRDWRTGEEMTIDPRLLEAVHALKAKLDFSGAMDMICGYRSSKTNKMLAQKSCGVARRSLHMEGRAIDIRFPKATLRRAHKAACSLKMGGVGLYAGSKDRFIHVDVRPRVVHWVG